MNLKSIKQGLVHILDESSFDDLMDARLPLRIKAGFDPTSPDLHLGHAVLLKKLRQFQDAGHTVVMIVGGATAQIGDPTGRNIARPKLSSAEIQENAWTYMSQAKKILLREQTVLRNNAEWFNSFSFSDMVELMSNFTLSEVGSRDDFKERAKNFVPVFLHELLYPALQAYDSYREGVDIEVGGNDQFYNLIMGREYMRKRGMKQQVILTVPLLEGLDGSQKMSKSQGNHISLTETPFIMFSQVMSISDELMDRWWQTLFPELLNQDLLNTPPFSRKQRLAWFIVNWLHSSKDADDSQREWQKIFTNRQIPTEIPELVVSDYGTRLDKLLVQAGLTRSFGEGQRLLKYGAIEVNGNIVETNDMSGYVDTLSLVIRVGRKWMKVKKTLTN